MGREADGQDRARQAVNSFTRFAAGSAAVGDTIGRALAVVAEALAVPACVLVKLTGASGAVVVQAWGQDRPAPGTELDVDPGTLSVLVCVDGRAWGKLAVPAPGGRDFTTADEDVLRAVATALGAAVERDQREGRRATLAALAGFALDSRDVLATMGRTVDALRGALDAPVAAVIRPGPAPTVMSVVYASSGSGVTTGQHYGVDTRLADLLRESERLVVGDCRTDGRFALPLLPAATVGSCVAVALPVQARTWGWLLAADPRPRSFSDAEIDFVAGAGSVLAGAMQRKRQEWARAGEVLLASARRAVPAETTEVALVDSFGVIVWVNRAWRRFAEENGGDPGRTGVGMSYLSLCDAAGDPASADLAEGIRAAIGGSLPAPMRVLLACHSPRVDRWFDVLVSSRFDDQGHCLGAAITLSPYTPDG